VRQLRRCRTREGAPLTGQPVREAPSRVRPYYDSPQRGSEPSLVNSGYASLTGRSSSITSPDLSARGQIRLFARTVQKYEGGRLPDGANPTGTLTREGGARNLPREGRVGILGIPPPPPPPPYGEGENSDSPSEPSLANSGDA